MVFQKTQVESQPTVFKPLLQHLSENQNYSLQSLLLTLELKRPTYKKLFLKNIYIYISYEFLKVFIL